MTKDTQYTILAILGGFAVCGFLLGLEFAGADLAGAGRKWFQLVLWTGFVFVLVAYHRRRWLRKVKARIIFVALLAAHIAVLVTYLRRAGQFPNLFFLIFSPLEVALVALVVGVVSGDIRRNKGPRGRSPHPNSRLGSN